MFFYTLGRVFLTVHFGFYMESVFLMLEDMGFCSVDGIKGYRVSVEGLGMSGWSYANVVVDCGVFFVVIFGFRVVECASFFWILCEELKGVYGVCVFGLTWLLWMGIVLCV